MPPAPSCLGWPSPVPVLILALFLPLFDCVLHATPSETLIYLMSTKIMLLNLLKRSNLNGGSESSANNLLNYLHTYVFQSSMTLFLKSPEYLVDVLSLLMILLTIAGG